MSQDLEWLLQQPVLPEPQPQPFTPRIFAPNADVIAEAQGCGVIAPLERDGRGDFKSACGREAIAASIRHILCVRCMSDTSRGEYPWKSSYGSLVHRVRHANANDGTIELARYYVVDAIRIWEPRVQIRDAVIQFEDNNTPGNPPGPGQVMRIFLVYDILGSRRGGPADTNVTQTVVTNNPFAEAA